MGIGASVTNSVPVENADNYKPVEYNLKRLPEAIEEAFYVHEKFPLIIDPTEQASRFLKYQTGSFLSYDDPVQSSKSAMNRALVGALQHGRSLTIKFQTLEGLNESVFEPGVFPIEVLSRSEFFKDEVWHSVIKTDLGDPNPSEVSISSEFLFIICTTSEVIPPQLYDVMHVFKIVDHAKNGESVETQTGDATIDQIASMFGAQEIIRNSTQLVEAAFDGDLECVMESIQKGYHLESCDGRKHTALSEAASQGNLHVIKFLLESGADPNALSDTNRSPLWRASFNGHIEAVKMLLEAGASPEFRDKVSMESAFDVARSDEIREYLANWDMAKTVTLMEERRRIMMENLEARIKTSAERELYARNMLRKELVGKAEQGDIEGIKEMLTMIAQEADQTNSKPRASVEVRNDSGQSLLSIAAQNDDEELAKFLLHYCEDIDKERWDLAEGEESTEKKVFRSNPNSRDMKGWSCVCIAVFHESLKVLKLLLEKGADPNIRSSYNKNAWDLSKDELDAAEHVIKSKEHIRQVLLTYDQSSSATGRLFGNGKPVKVKENSLYTDLGDEGSPVVMNIEINKEMENAKEKTTKKKGTVKGKANATNASNNTKKSVAAKKKG